MASSDTSIKIVDSADVADDGPLVKVDSVEKSSQKEEDGEVKTENSKPPPNSETKVAESSHRKEVVHDGDEVKTTYDVEEDVPPSLLEQLKRKIHWNGR